MKFELGLLLLGKGLAIGIEACEFHAWALEAEGGEYSTPSAVKICDEIRKPFEIKMMAS